MDKDYFINAGMPFQWSGQNCTSEQSFLDPNSSMDKFSQFESSLSSMVSSSPAAAATGSDAFILRELIGNLGGGGAAFPMASHTNSTNDSAQRTPLSSPPKLHLPILDMPNMGNNSSVPPLPSLSSDPGFAERAAKFSCFGSRSFNGRTSPFEMNNGELGLRSSNPLMANEKLPRVSSSPSLKSQLESKNLRQTQMEIGPVNGIALVSDKKMSRLSGSGANSNEESSVSEQIETGSKNSNELNSRKRKVVSRGKTKEDRSTPAKVVEGDENGNAKRSKPAENGKSETKAEEEANGEESEKQKTNQKPPEPPKDYIHVRARRGQATDSHSLAERVRREKISERMKLLQDLVPGCNKVTGKALMLDEIINYVQSLQRQVEFLSMKLASVNPGLDINMENLLSKDVFQQNTTLPQQMYPLDSSSPAFYHHQNVQQIHNTNISSGPLSHCSMDPLGIQLPSVDGFSESLPQFPGFSEDDLQSIVQMGFANFQVPNQTSNMKVER